MKILTDLVVLCAYLAAAVCAISVTISGGSNFEVGLNKNTLFFACMMLSISTILILWSLAWKQVNESNNEEDQHWKRIIKRWAFLGAFIYYFKVMRKPKIAQRMTYD